MTITNSPAGFVYTHSCGFTAAGQSKALAQEIGKAHEEGCRA